MKTVTLLFLRDASHEHVLLAMKKRGFGSGKFNGVGGKVQEGETIERAAVREAEEEIGVTIKEPDLQPLGVIMFHFIEHPDWDLKCHVFATERWQGLPAESEEMAPEWFAIKDIPFDRMWVDDRYWLLRALEGEFIDATFYFSGDGGTIARSVINTREEQHAAV